ncbi:MAG TPA: diacylglycerol kinase family protein [Gemmatimonadaceae bacterium]|nr:diacylglycerol kinase family protein [Gemmatimonadaceae bacterium]
MELLKDTVLLIANPASRRGARLQTVAMRAFRRAGVRYDAVITEHPGHAAELASHMARRYRAVFTLGGDGTAMEVVGALAHSGIPVGILAGGTGNLVARSLGIPLRIADAVHALLTGDEALMDLGAMNNGRRFAFTLGVGVDARMIHETGPIMKRRFGIGAYAATATRATLIPRPFHIRAVVDGEVYEREAVSVMLANFGSVLNDLLVLGPGIRQDDGLLDLCVFSPRGTSEALRLAWRLFRQDFRTEPALLYKPGRLFRIECDPPQLYQADGEVIGTTPVSAHVEPLAARVMVPRRS